MQPKKRGWRLNMSSDQDRWMTRHVDGRSCKCSFQGSVVRCCDGIYLPSAHSTADGFFFTWTLNAARNITPLYGDGISSICQTLLVMMHKVSIPIAIPGLEIVVLSCAFCFVRVAGMVSAIPTKRCKVDYRPICHSRGDVLMWRMRHARLESGIECRKETLVRVLHNLHATNLHALLQRPQKHRRS